MKELDDRSADLIKSFDLRQSNWFRRPGTVVWVLWLGEDMEQAKSWVIENGIENVAVGVVSPLDPDLARWNLHPMAMNSLVLTSAQREILFTAADVAPEHLDALQSRLEELVLR